MLYNQPDPSCVFDHFHHFSLLYLFYSLWPYCLCYYSFNTPTISLPWVLYICLPLSLKHLSQLFLWFTPHDYRSLFTSYLFWDVFSEHTALYAIVQKCIQLPWLHFFFSRHFFNIWHIIYLSSILECSIKGAKNSLLLSHQSHNLYREEL